MHKRLIPWYLILFPIISVGSILYACYEIYRHGIEQGLLLILLSLSAYILCIPAAHGRILFGIIAKKFKGASFFPEPYLWGVAVAVNVFSLLFMPQIYPRTMITFILYRVFIFPSYWIILLLGAAGVWYRSLLCTVDYQEKRKMHTLIRHLITLFGVLLIFYLLHQDFIVLLNVTTTG